MYYCWCKFHYNPSKLIRNGTSFIISNRLIEEWAWQVVYCGVPGPSHLCVYAISRHPWTTNSGFSIAAPLFYWFKDNSFWFVFAYVRVHIFGRILNIFKRSSDTPQTASILVKVFPLKRIFRVHAGLANWDKMASTPHPLGQPFTNQFSRSMTDEPPGKRVSHDINVIGKHDMLLSRPSWWHAC